MQPLGTKRLRALLDKKITQPPGTTKLQNLFGQNNHPTSWDKKNIMQPLATKKNLRNLLGHKKSCNLLEQKKITQPLGTNKITQPLGTTKNHASS